MHALPYSFLSSPTRYNPVALPISQQPISSSFTVHFSYLALLISFPSVTGTYRRCCACARRARCTLVCAAVDRLALQLRTLTEESIYMMLLQVASLTGVGTATVSRAALSRLETPRILCGRCGRAGTTCVCSALPESPIATSTRVLILQHPREARKRICSVPLIPLCLREVEVVRATVPWVSGNEPLQNLADIAIARRSLEEGYEPLLLFPGPSAIALDAANAIEMPSWSNQSERARTTTKVLLVVIDGTWSQARHLMLHSPSLAQQCTHVMFQGERRAIIGALRREPEQHCTSTLEACARALRLLEPTEHAVEAADRMEACLALMVERQLERMPQAQRSVAAEKRLEHMRMRTTSERTPTTQQRAAAPPRDPTSTIFS